ncbi:peptide synthetase, partial [Pseudomonas syringae]
GDVGALRLLGPGRPERSLGRPHVTQETSRPNPGATGYHDARLCRTGDRARSDDEGQVRCLGRADDQGKIRGFRVELGEIESLLAQQPGVGTVAVLLRSEAGVDPLIAYLVSDTSTPSAVTSQLRKTLQAQLPPDLVPGHVDMVSSRPRPTHGNLAPTTVQARPLT